MKILLALNSFKGSCSSLEANNALRKGLAGTLNPDSLTTFPLCDGGDGSVLALAHHLHLKPVWITASDALGHELKAPYLFEQESSTAYIEMAAASGLAVLNGREKNIWISNTMGTGELVQHALKRKARRVILMVGGSATNDAGLGIMHRLGIRFLDKKGRVLDPVPANLIQIHAVDTRMEMEGSRTIEIWTDVTNPFYGPEGAVEVYGPQKGAGPPIRKKLEKGMIHFARVIHNQFGTDLQKVKGSGAAGGIGGGMHGIMGCTIHHGTSRIFELLRFREKVQAHDLVITGEGALDFQSRFGKLVHGVLKTAGKCGKPVIGLCGSLQMNTAQNRKMGFSAAFSIVRGPEDLETAIKMGKENLEAFGANLAALIRVVYSSSSRRE
ncbi:MAG TPA: glycerate kinase [Saprospiraceae bacterium]|nr:glycerate kinase [Saprospiraceae bacterium]HNT20701.1 glycerate kinase [Saprospiraceae bacterium]